MNLLSHHVLLLLLRNRLGVMLLLLLLWVHGQPLLLLLLLHQCLLLLMGHQNLKLILLALVVHNVLMVVLLLDHRLLVLGCMNLGMLVLGCMNLGMLLLLRWRHLVVLSVVVLLDMLLIRHVVAWLQVGVVLLCMHPGKFQNGVNNGGNEEHSPRQYYLDNNPNLINAVIVEWSVSFTILRGNDRLKS
jgi:hypothetical protein